MEKEGNISDSSCELSLSCASSPFGSLGQNSDLDQEAGTDLFEQIRPYQFEPLLSDASNSDESDGDQISDDERRLQNNEWCRCGNCQIMQSGKESICCCEIDRVYERKCDVEGAACITDHPGFSSVCLDLHVLEVAYLQYRQQYGERPEQNNERYRYTAYRQFARWCWHFLGKEVKVVLPSCVVLRIRETFPDPSHQYTGFHMAGAH